MTLIVTAEDKFNAEIAHLFMIRNPEYIPCDQNVHLFELWFKITKKEWTITHLENAYSDFKEFMIKRKEKLVPAGWKPEIRRTPEGAWTFGVWANSHAKILLSISFGSYGLTWRYK